MAAKKVNRYDLGGLSGGGIGRSAVGARSRHVPLYSLCSSMVRVIVATNHSLAMTVIV